MLSHCPHFCGRMTDTGRHNYYILQRQLCYARVAPVSRISVSLGPHQKKNGSAVQLARRDAANKWRTVCCCWPYKPVTWLSRINESTRGSATKIGRRLRARRREGKTDERILIRGKREMNGREGNAWEGRGGGDGVVEEDGVGARWKFTSSSVARFRVGAEVEDPRRALPLRPVAILLSRT